MPVNRLKTTYQRNFLIGTLSAAAFVLVICGFIYLNREPVRTVTISTDEIVFTDFEFKAAGRGMAEQDKSGLAGGVHHGFNLPAEAPMGTGRPDPLPALAHKLGSPFPGETPLEASFAGANDRPMPVPYPGDPADDYYGYAVPNDRHPKYGGNAYPVKIERPGNPNRPLWISGLRVTHPFNPIGLVDTVIVLMSIDKNGSITGIEIIYDALPGMGFAERFILALHAARIYPAWKDGQPVGGTYPIWCIFERSSARERVKNSPNITISSSF